jgi:nuclear pore complex protein Nup53
MIGVSRCTDSSLIEKENDGGQQANVSKIRSLTQAAYKSAQEPTEVVLSPNAPKRTTGIINKTLDMFFGW